MADITSTGAAADPHRSDDSQSQQRPQPPSTDAPQQQQPPQPTNKPQPHQLTPTKWPPPSPTIRPPQRSPNRRRPETPTSNTDQHPVTTLSHQPHITPTDRFALNSSVASNPATTNKIAIMQLFHEMKQEFATVPDDLVQQLVVRHSNDRPALLRTLHAEASRHPGTLHSYPQALRGKSSPPASPPVALKADNAPKRPHRPPPSPPLRPTVDSARPRRRLDSAPQRPAAFTATGHPPSAADPVTSTAHPLDLSSEPPTLAPETAQRPRTLVIQTPCAPAALRPPPIVQRPPIVVHRPTRTAPQPPAAVAPRTVRHTTELLVQPELWPGADALGGAATTTTATLTTSSLCSADPPAAARRSFTSVQFKLRSPTECAFAPHPEQTTAMPIDISAGSAGLIYSSSSYDAQNGLQRNFRITVDGGGNGTISAVRTRPRPPAVGGAPVATASTVATGTPGELRQQADIVHRQRERKQRLHDKLNGDRDRLRRIRQEVETLRRPMPDAGRLKEDIMRLMSSIERLVTQVEQAGPYVLGETNEAFYHQIVSSQTPAAIQRPQLPTANPAHSRPHPMTLDSRASVQGLPWSCNMCTFQNHPLLNKCEQCEMPLLTTSGTVPNQGANAAAAAAAFASAVAGSFPAQQTATNPHAFDDSAAPSVA